MDISKLLKLFFILIKLHVILFALFAIICAIGLYVGQDTFTKQLYGIGTMFGVVGFIICTVLLFFRKQIESLNR